MSRESVSRARARLNPHGCEDYAPLFSRQQLAAARRVRQAAERRDLYVIDGAEFTPEELTAAGFTPEQVAEMEREAARFDAEAAKAVERFDRCRTDWTPEQYAEAVERFNRQRPADWTPEQVEQAAKRFNRRRHDWTPGKAAEGLTPQPAGNDETRNSTHQ